MNRCGYSGPSVVGARADQAVVGVLLEDVRRPARHAADREDRRVEVDGNPERVVHRRRVEVDVRVQLLLALHQRLDALRHVPPGRMPGAAAEVLRHLPQVRGARVFGLVDAMAEARDLLLARELALHEVVDAVAAGVLAEIEQHLHHLGVGAAVQRALQRADGRDDRRVDVGERGGGHARREGRRVQLVIGVQRERDVEGFHRERAGPIPGQHVEEIGGLAHGRIRGNRSAARLHPAPGGDDGARLRRETNRLAVLRLGRRVVGLGVVVRERRRHRPQRVHAIDRRQAAHQPDDRLGQRPRRRQLRLQIAELRARRQPAMPEQVADLLEGRELGQVVDVVAAVGEHAALAVEIADRRRRRDDVLEPGFAFLAALLRYFLGRHPLILCDRASGKARSRIDPAQRDVPLVAAWRA